MVLWAPSIIMVKMDLLNYTASPSATSNRDIRYREKMITREFVLHKYKLNIRLE
jgi:hypothetical protein